MPSNLTAGRFIDHVRAAGEVFVPGCAGHSLLFEQWLREAADAAAGTRFFGVHIPGFNRFDFAALDPAARFAGPFMSPDWSASWASGRFEHRPQTYSRCARWLAEDAAFDLALLQLAPPDADGRCSFGVACDFGPLAWSRARRVLAHINPSMPRTRGPWVPWAALDAAVEADLPLLAAAPPAADARIDAVAAQVAACVPDGAVLQLGLGRLQSAVLAALRDRRELRIHSGMVSDGLLDLVDAGALSASDDAVVAGVALGGEGLYARAAEHVRFAAVDHTHDGRVLRGLPRLHAINSALEVDLFGQVNAECLDGRFVSGVGGLADFLVAAAARGDGRGIVGLPSRTPRGAPRIVARLGTGPASIARTDVDMVVTEHGSTRLRDLDVDARARALIGIAHPGDREALARDWHMLRRSP